MARLSNPKSIFWNVVASGVPRDTDSEIFRKLILLNLMMSFGCVATFVFAVINWFHGEFVIVIADIISFAVLSCGIIYLRYVKKIWFVGLSTTIYFGGFFMFLLLGGAETTYIWVFTFPLISVFLLGIYLGVGISIVFLGLMTLMLVVAPGFEMIRQYPMELKTRIIPLYILILIFVSIVELHREKILKILHQTKKSLHDSLDELEKSKTEKERLIGELEQNLEEVKILQGILPICASCKKIRDDDGYWNKVENYLSDHSRATFEQGLCSECTKKHE